MTDRIRLYVGEIFKKAPLTQKAVELREEVCSNLIDKYNDMKVRGASDEEAYTAAIASIGDEQELLNMLEPPAAPDPKDAKRNALMVSVAVGLYIISIVPLIVSDSAGYDPIIGLVFMFIVCAVATGLLIYNSLSRSGNVRMDDSLVEEFKEWKQNKGKSSRETAITSALWLVTIAVYLAVSFLFNAWFISWVIFLIASAVERIITVVVREKK